jgi:hypothetical protein
MENHKDVPENIYLRYIFLKITHAILYHYYKVSHVQQCAFSTHCLHEK